MTDLERLRRDINTLKESIELSRTNLHQRTEEELRGILENIRWCLQELQKLLAELEPRIKPK